MEARILREFVGMRDVLGKPGRLAVPQLTGTTQPSIRAKLVSEANGMENRCRDVGRGLWR